MIVWLGRRTDRTEFRDSDVVMFKKNENVQCSRPIVSPAAAAQLSSKDVPKSDRGQAASLSNFLVMPNDLCKCKCTSSSIVLLYVECGRTKAPLWPPHISAVHGMVCSWPTCRWACRVQEEQTHRMQINTLDK